MTDQSVMFKYGNSNHLSTPLHTYKLYFIYYRLMVDENMYTNCDIVV